MFAFGSYSEVTKRLVPLIGYLKGIHSQTANHMRGMRSDKPHARGLSTLCLMERFHIFGLQSLKQIIDCLYIICL